MDKLSGINVVFVSVMLCDSTSDLNVLKNVANLSIIKYNETF
jgi:hypothetical protein